MSQRGWRQVRIWAPDTRSPSARASLAEQSQAIRQNGADEQAVMKWLAEPGDWPDWR
jgi:hypothetical protein